MDRSLKAPDNVSVYAHLSDQGSRQPVDKVQKVPYSFCGLDYYEYRTDMYGGYRNQHSGEVFIALDRPMPRTAHR